MIELVNSRKMIICVVTLIVMSILVIILESFLTENPIRPLPHHLPSPMLAKSENLHELMKNHTEYCWIFEPYAVKSDCVRCTKDEVSKLAICSDGFKQSIHCEISGDVWTHCQPATMKQFFMFELTMLSLAALGALSINHRIKVLEQRASARYRGSRDFGV